MNYLSKAYGHSITEAEELFASYSPEARQQVLNNALFLASQYENTREEMAWLIAHGADVNYKEGGDSALSEAIIWGGGTRVEKAQFLLDAGLNIACFPDALHMCIEGRIMYSEQSPGPSEVFQEMTEFLIQAGFPLNYQDEDGNTALHKAVSRYAGSYNFAYDLVPILVRHGADVTLRNTAGESPLDLARRHGDKDAVAIMEKEFA